MCDLSLVPNKFNTVELLAVLGSVAVFWWSSERRLMFKNDDLGRVADHIPVDVRHK